MAFRLITSEDLKALTKGDFGNSFDYLIDEIIIPAVGDYFASHCHRPSFDKLSRSEFFSPLENRKNVFLSSPPIAASPAVQVFEDTYFPRTYPVGSELVNGVDYVVHPEAGVIEKIGCFASGPRTVKVVYTGGFATGDGIDVPSDLKFAALMQTKILFDRREEFSLQSRSLEGGAVSLLIPLTLPQSVTKILDGYRLYNI